MGSSSGQLGLESLWVVIVLFIFGLGLVYGYSAFSELNDDIQADASLSQDAKDASEATVGNYASNMDSVFFFFFILLWVFILATAFFANTHPVLIVITVVLIVIGLVVMMYLANTFEEATGEAEVSSAAAEFPKMMWILEHIVLVMSLVGFSVMMVLYSRSRA